MCVSTGRTPGVLQSLQLLLFMLYRIVAKSAHFLLQVRPSFRMYQFRNLWKNFCQIWFWRLSWKSVEKFENFLKLGKIIGLFKLPASWNGHKNVLFECYGIRLLGEPITCKHNANATQFYVTPTLPILFKRKLWASYVSCFRCARTAGCRIPSRGALPAGCRVACWSVRECGWVIRFPTGVSNKANSHIPYRAHAVSLRV